MDANGTRFHLLLGRDDWARCRTVGGVPAFDSSAAQVEWVAARHEVTLWKQAFRFTAARGTRMDVGRDRRGAARDRFGNWYWIAPDRGSVFVLSAGSEVVSTLWPPAEDCAATGTPAGSFRPRAPTVRALPVLQGLAVTDDHYLVVGTTVPAGLLVFDLYAVGAPRQRLWPVAFEPFDIVARTGGGVWILDRAHRRVWELDRRLEVVAPAPANTPPPPNEGCFTSVGGDEPGGSVSRIPMREVLGWPVAAGDPVAIAALTGGGVLVLEADDGTGFARVHRLERGTARGAPATTRGMAAHVEARPAEAPFTLLGYDLAFVPHADDDPSGQLGRAYVVAPDGNQAYAFDVVTEGDRLELAPVAEYFPLRLFGGRAITAADREVWYDCEDRWVRLVRQNRPRYAESGEVWTPVLDGGEPGCVWHRLMLDACIPPGAAIDVSTRASDDWRELTLVEWLQPAERRALGAPEVAEAGDAISEDEIARWQPEPAPYLRGDGSELPYAPKEEGPGRGTWELLFQRARGRYLQIRLLLRGDGRTTPRVRALRAWYPRFSYLEHYLPAVYRDDATSASFLDRFLANVEGTLTAIEDRIAAAQVLLDVASAPSDALDWLGRWLGVALDPAWDDERRRLFLRHAVAFFAFRGTARGVQVALRLALDECVDDRLFARPDRAARRVAPVRIVERYRTRGILPALLGDVTTAVPGPRRLDAADAAARWLPDAGGAELSRRWREALGLPPGAEFPLAAADAPDGWREFAQRALGFVPAGGAERAAWQAYLRHRYGTVAALDAAHGSAWPTFEAVRLPTADPPPGPVAADWSAFLSGSESRERRLWGDFLARRYRTVGALLTAWRRNWTSFGRIPLPDRLPGDGPPLADWFQFEGTVLAMHRVAHRFTVMLPVPPHLRTDTPAQQRRLALARRVLELEKPAHTAYDLRFYWAMFRLGEARLGDDTLVDLGSRSPELMAPMVLGEGYLAEAFLAAPSGRDAPARLQIGRDRVGRSARLGGP
jgi:phage tail-like protein